MNQVLKLKEYTKKYIVERGDTKERKDKFKELGGICSPNLKQDMEVPDSIFPSSKEQVNKYIDWVNNNQDGIYGLKEDSPFTNYCKRVKRKRDSFNQLTYVYMES